MVLKGGLARGEILFILVNTTGGILAEVFRSTGLSRGAESAIVSFVGFDTFGVVRNNGK